MRTQHVRAFLAIAVVGVFMGITGFMAIYPLVASSNVDMDKYADFFAKTASVYTGIIGVIIGFYFGRSETAESQKVALLPKTGNDTVDNSSASIADKH